MFLHHVLLHYKLVDTPKFEYLISSFLFNSMILWSVRITITLKVSTFITFMTIYCSCDMNHNDLMSLLILLPHTTYAANGWDENLWCLIWCLTFSSGNRLKRRYHKDLTFKHLLETISKFFFTYTLTAQPSRQFKIRISWKCFF